MEEKTTEATTTDQLLEQIASLPSEEKHRLVYELTLEQELERISEWSSWCLDWLDKNEMVNNYERKTSDMAPSVGMLRTLSVLVNRCFESQARQEMQVMDEDTQWAVKLSDTIADLTTNLRNDAEHLAQLVGHYTAVLKGRRMGIHYLDETGRATEAKASAETSD